MLRAPALVALLLVATTAGSAHAPSPPKKPSRPSPIWTLDLATAAYGAGAVGDIDGDGALDVFVVTGQGTSGRLRAQNYGRAWAIRAGAGSPLNGNAWTMFRGNLRRTGRRR